MPFPAWCEVLMTDSRFGPLEQLDGASLGAGNGTGYARSPELLSRWHKAFLHISRLTIQGLRIIARANGDHV